MVKLYRKFRIFILAILSFIVVFIVYMELSFCGNAHWIDKINDTSFYTNYAKFHRVLMYDPYIEQIINFKNENVTLLTNVFYSRVKALKGFTHDKFFNEQLFSFYISQKIDNIKSLSEKYFSSFPDFRDLVIIDKQKNLIFKYGDENFSVQYYNMTNKIDGIYLKDLIAIVLRSNDATLEYEYEVIALFDYSKFTALLQDLPTAGFVLLNDRLIRNQEFPKSIFKYHRKNILAETKKRYGLKILEIYPLYIAKRRVGYSGILYPIRSFGSYLVFILKLGVFVFLILIFILLDKKLLEKLHNRQMEFEERKILREKKNLNNNNDEESSLMDTNLDWIENFIEETEVRKK